jgi:hypothetical protein
MGLEGAAINAVTAAPKVEAVVAAPIAAEAAAVTTTAVPAVEGFVTTTANAVTAEVTTETVAGATQVGAETAQVASEEVNAASQLEKALKGGTEPESALHDFTATTSNLTVAGETSTSTIPEAKSAETAEPANPTDSQPKTTEASKTTAPVAEQAAPETLTPEAKIEQQVTKSMSDWDEKNPVPEDEKSFQSYLDKRAQAEKTVTVSARVESDMETWQKENPNATQAEIDAQRNKLTNDHSKKYDKEVQSGVGRREEDGGMSAAEFAKKIHQLEELIANQAEIRRGISLIQSIPPKDRTPQNNTQLQVLINQDKSTSATIISLQAELRIDAAISRSMWKKAVLPMLLVGMVAAGPAMQRSDEESIAGSQK